MAPRKRRARNPASSPLSNSASVSASASGSASGSASPSDGAPPVPPSEAPQEDMIREWEARGREVVETAAMSGEPENGGWCVAEVTLGLVGELLEWAVREVCVEEHWKIWRERGGDCLAVGEDTRLGGPGTGGGLGAIGDGEEEGIEGKKAAKHVGKSVNVECSNCGGNIAAARYAQHLEKCLGRGGRSSSRAASARLKASAKKAEKDDLEQMHPVPSLGASRKRRSGSVYALGADGREVGGKRRKSQSPTPGTAALPPSGRNKQGLVGQR